MTTHSLRLLPGQDLKLELDDLVDREEWTAACLLTGVGSLSKATIRFANQKEAEVLEGPFEILTLAGTLSPNGSHLHLSVSDEKGQVRGGHLMTGSTIFTTAEIVIGILSGWDFTREVDEGTGHAELSVKPVGPSD